MSETSAVPQNEVPLITPAPQLVPRRGAGGGGGGSGGGAGRRRRAIRPCGYIDGDIALQLANKTSSSYSSTGARVGCTASYCAFSGSFVGCVKTIDTTISNTATITTPRIVPTTCVGYEVWASQDSEFRGRSDVHLCTRNDSPSCQELHFVQETATFTGFTCVKITTGPVTATGGSWATFGPTSIPNNVDDFFWVATNTTTVPLSTYPYSSPTATTTNVPSAANASMGSGSGVVGIVALFTVLGAMVGFL